MRHSVRALIVDPDDRVLLCRFDLPHPAVPSPAMTVWAAPGGGIEPGEDRLTALRRELREETGLILDGDPPHVWHQVAQFVNDYYLVRTAAFEPRGELTDEELLGEHLVGFRWWSLPEIAGYAGPDLFSPRDLVTPLTALLTGGPPEEPVRLGL